MVGGTEHTPQAGAGSDAVEEHQQLEPDSATALAEAVDAMNAVAPEAEDSAPGDLGEPKPESQA